MEDKKRVIAIDLGDSDKKLKQITSPVKTSELSSADKTKQMLGSIGKDSAKNKSKSAASSAALTKMLADFLSSTSSDKGSSGNSSSNSSSSKNGSKDDLSKLKSALEKMLAGLKGGSDKNAKAIAEFLDGLETKKELPKDMSEFFDKLDNLIASTSSEPIKYDLDEVLNYGNQNQVDPDIILGFLDGLRGIYGATWDSELFSKLEKVIKRDYHVAIEGIGYLITNNIKNKKLEPIKVEYTREVKNFIIDGWEPETWLAANPKMAIEFFGIMEEREPEEFKTSKEILEIGNFFQQELEKLRKESLTSRRVNSNNFLGKASEKYGILKKSAEQRVVQFYRTKTYGTSQGNFGGNTFTQRLVDVLKPPVGSRWDGRGVGFNGSGLSPDTWSTLIAQNFYSSTLPKPEYTPKVHGKKVPNIEYSYTENTSLGVYNNILSYSGKDVIKVMKGLGFSGGKNAHYLRPHLQVSEENFEVIKPTETRTILNLRSSLDSARRNYNNLAIKCLLRDMPNFSPNMYFGIFTQYNLDESNDKIIEDFIKISNKVGNNNIGSDIKGSLEDVLSTYFVRLQSVDIPKATVSTEELVFAGRKIPKISSKFKEEHTATLTFTLDEYGMILRQFNLLSGIYGSGKDEIDNMRLYSSITGTSGKTYPNTFFPSTFFNNRANNVGRRLDLSIIYNDFRTNQDFDNQTHKSSFGLAQKHITNEDGLVENVIQNKVIGSYSSYRTFVFEDVRVLGVSSPVKFERDTSKSTTVSVSILFKRVKTVDANPEQN